MTTAEDKNAKASKMNWESLKSSTENVDECTNEDITTTDVHNHVDICLHLLIRQP